jgi:hypothetical protein
VPKKFRFPFFTKFVINPFYLIVIFIPLRLCWYAGERYLQDLKSKEEFPHRVLEGIQALAQFLVSEVRNMERGAEQVKKEAKEQVPVDRVKDPAALARELRWRAVFAGGHFTDDEDPYTVPKDGKAALNGNDRNANKRTRDLPDEAEECRNKRSFKPKLWDAVVEEPVEHGKQVLKARRPSDWIDWKEVWTCKSALQADEVNGEDATVTRQQNVVVKVRRTSNGMERQRVERVLEEWTWAETSSAIE